MHFDMLKPCNNCPFLREGGIRLTQGRVNDIAGMMLHSQGGTFPCHKTVEYADSDEDEEVDWAAQTQDTSHCAGALIFAEKNDTATQMMRIAERIGMYNRDKLLADQTIVALVFDTLDEMLQVNEAAEGARMKPILKGGNRNECTNRSSGSGHRASDESRRRAARVAQDPKRRRKRNS